jgi:hypothetical protein
MKKVFNLKLYKQAIGLEELHERGTPLNETMMGEYSDREKSMDYVVQKLDHHFHAHTVIDIDGRQKLGDIVPLGEYELFPSQDWQSRILMNLKTGIKYVIYSDILRQAIDRGTILELDYEE